MSAYICNPEHFGILGATAAQNHCVIREWSQKTHADDTPHEAQRVARCLALENIRSVAYRYPLSESGDRPGPNLRDEEIVEAAALYAGYFIEHPQRLTSARILSLIACLDYQSCETDDWPQTLAYRQLQLIKGTVIPGPVGFDDGQWRFHPADCRDRSAIRAESGMKYHYETAVRWYRYQDDADVRVGARPPKGWEANAEIRDTHPITGRPLKSVQWWVREHYTGG